MASTSAWLISDGSLYELTRAAQAGRPYDHAFLADAGRGDLAEITLGQIALERSANADVRQYAQAELVGQHSEFQARLLPLLTARGLPAPAPAPQDDLTAAWLRSLPVDRFDRAFADFLEDDHRRTAQRYQLELDAGVDADVLPHILRHRADAAQLRAAAGGG